MTSLAPDYKRALYWALGLHLGIFIMMMLEIDFPWQNQKPSITYAIQNVEVIQAHVVPQASLDAQVQRKKEVEQQMQAARLAEIEKQKQAEAARLAAIEQQKKAQESARLELKKQEEAKAAQLAAAEQQKQMEAAKKAEAVKQAELAKQQEATKQAELAKQQEIAKQAELAKQQEAAKQQQLLAEQAAATQQQAQAQQAILSEVERYTLLVKQKVMQNWLIQHGFTGLSTELHVRVAPSGTVLDVQIIKNSGNEAMDRSAISAVHRASPLPVPTDPAVFESFREIRLILRPEDAAG